VQKLQQVTSFPDIWVTHMPPYGLCDRALRIFPGEREYNIGDRQIGMEVNTIQPEIHIFGHIHEARGKDTYPNGITQAINVACLDETYRLVNPFNILTFVELK
jgi:Icc-related predicted phosphoesterase